MQQKQVDPIVHTFLVSVPPKSMMQVVYQRILGRVCVMHTMCLSPLLVSVTRSVPLPGQLALLFP